MIPDDEPPILKLRFDNPSLEADPPPEADDRSLPACKLHHDKHCEICKPNPEPKPEPSAPNAAAAKLRRPSPSPPADADPRKLPVSDMQWLTGEEREHAYRAIGIDPFTGERIPEPEPPAPGKPDYGIKTERWLDARLGWKLGTRRRNGFTRQDIFKQCVSKTRVRRALAKDYPELVDKYKALAQRNTTVAATALALEMSEEDLEILLACFEYDAILSAQEFDIKLEPSLKLRPSAEVVSIDSDDGIYVDNTKQIRDFAIAAAKGSERLAIYGRGVRFTARGVAKIRPLESFDTTHMGGGRNPNLEREGGRKWWEGYSKPTHDDYDADSGA